MEQRKTRAHRSSDTPATGFPESRLNTRGTEPQIERGADRKKDKTVVRFSRILRENDLYERQDS